MKSRHLFLVAVVAAGALFAPAFGQTTPQEQRIQAAYELTLGRPATAEQVAELDKLGTLSVKALIEQLRQGLTPERIREVVIKAGADAFGRAPNAVEIAAVGGDKDYAQLIEQHLQWLMLNRAVYEQVVRRAYQRVLDRDPYPDEVQYWQVRPVTSYVLLVGCVNDWALRNAPGLMETTGTAAIAANSRYLATTILSPAVAAEVRDATGLLAPNPVLAVAADRNIVAPGGTWVLSVRGIPFVAVGRGTAITAGE